LETALLFLLYFQDDLSYIIRLQFFFLGFVFWGRHGRKIYETVYLEDHMGLSNKVLDGVVWDNIVAVAIFHLSFLAAAYLLFNHEKD
jgi:hypothetical protein